MQPSLPVQHVRACWHAHGMLRRRWLAHGVQVSAISLLPSLTVCVPCRENATVHSGACGVSQDRRAK